MSKQIKLSCCLFYGFEPLDCGGGVFPLVELGCSHDFAVNSVEDSFADLSYLRFGGVDQPAGWFVGEVRFVVFEGYECFFVSCLLPPATGLWTSSDSAWHRKPLRTVRTSQKPP